MKIAVIILSIISVGLIGGSYYLYDSYDTMQAEVQSLQDTKNDLMFKVDDLETEKAKIEQELEEKISDISKEKKRNSKTQRDI